ncbi:MAG: tyrosine-type recombinase/integrase [Cellulomonas sp.]
MGKRANDEGSIYRRRSDGRYVSAVTWSDPNTGAHRRTTYYGDTRSEVRAKLDAAMDRRRQDLPVKDATMTLASWAQHWMETTLPASPRKATTKELYVSLIRSHILTSAIAKRGLDQVRASHIDAFVMELARKPKPGARRHGSAINAPVLADASVQRVFYVLRQILDGAVRDGLIARNPASGVKPPAIAAKEARFLSSADVARLLDAAHGSRYAAILTFIAATGARKGEAMALAWKDVDFDRAEIRIVSTLSRIGGRLVVTSPKTARSRRVLPLSEGMSKMLRELQAQQLRERKAARDLWQESGLVFTSESGAPLDPRNVLRAMTTAARKVGLEGVTVHTLRHSAATAMLEAGIHIKAVSELLGHSDIRITGDVYGHVSTETAKAAMDSLSGRLGI